jgi:hypothetical protein|tara:strand:- start:427 stop:627 length:201 start_codon:yes stop_codon:yes gene_type:complete
MKKMNKRMKKLDIWDMALTKLTVLVGTLFILTIWPAAMDFVVSVNPWWFLAAFVVFAARPMVRWLG